MTAFNLADHSIALLMRSKTHTANSSLARACDSRYGFITAGRRQLRDSAQRNSVGDCQLKLTSLQTVDQAFHGLRHPLLPPDKGV
jgi:hypothetical protein